MLNFIIGNNLIEIVKIIAIAFIVMIFISALAESEGFRKIFVCIVGVVSFLALIVSGAYSFGRINNYYSSKGGIIGTLTDLIDTNKTHTKVEENKLTYSFENFQMQKDDKGYYSVEKNENSILKIEKNETYIAYVNGYPCEIINLVIGDDDTRFIYRFSYVFADYDENGYLIPIADDTIQIEFTFYESSTKIKIKTNCSDEVYGLWNSYFNKNNFEITLEKTDSSIEEKQELVTVTLLVDDEVYSVVKLKQGSNYILPKIEKDEFIFNGFELNGEKVEILKNIQSDTTLIANFTDEFDLMSIKELEFYILDTFGITIDDIESFEELSELDFYKTFFAGVFKDTSEHTLDYYKTTISQTFSFEVPENPNFRDYLRGFYNYIKENLV